MKFWKCPSCGNSNRKEIIRCMCGRVGDFFEQKQLVIEEEKNAFRNDIACSDNPYRIANEDLANLWKLGWTEAEKARAYYLPKILKTQDREAKITNLIEDSNDATGDFLGKVFIFLFKAVMIIAGVCIVIFLIYQIFEIVGSRPSWAVVIIMLLLIILAKRKQWECYLFIVSKNSLHKLYH